MPFKSHFFSESITVVDVPCDERMFISRIEVLPAQEVHIETVHFKTKWVPVSYCTTVVRDMANCENVKTNTELRLLPKVRPHAFGEAIIKSTKKINKSFVSTFDTWQGPPAIGFSSAVHIEPDDSFDEITVDLDDLDEVLVNGDHQHVEQITFNGDLNHSVAEDLETIIV